jgi:predicted dinucleotide-binding enzyme
MAETSTKASPKKAVTKPVVASAKPEVKKPATSAKPAAKTAAASVKPAVKEPAVVKKPATAKAAVAKPAAKTAVASKVMIVSDEQRYRMVAEAAYYHAERNQFKSDHVRDWIDAERDIAALLSGGK